MKKIIGLIVIVILGVVGYKGYEYYHSTYVGETAYAYVPTEVPQKEQTKDSGGKDVAGWSSYKYQFTFVKANGETQSMGYELSGSNPTPFTPGAIVKAVISEKRVLKGPNIVEKDSVSKDILNKLDNQK